MSGRKCCDNGKRAKRRWQEGGGGAGRPCAAAMSRPTQIKGVVLMEKRTRTQTDRQRATAEKEGTQTKTKQKAYDGNVPFLF